MPSEDIQIFQFNQYYKSNKTPFIVYVDLESLLKRMGKCTNNPEKSSAAKVSEHISSSFSICTILSFKDIENKHDV